MDADEADFRALLDRARSGDADAARELCARYSTAVRAVVRRRLHPRLRTQYDSLDFVQEVWTAVLTGPDRGDFASQEALIGFLTRVAENKVVDVHRERFETGKRDITREVAGVGPREGQVAARYPTPSQWAIAGERWEDLLRSVPDAHRAVLERLRAGYSLDEIAQQIGVSVSTVNRIVRKLKEAAGVEP